MPLRYSYAITYSKSNRVTITVKLKYLTNCTNDLCDSEEIDKQHKPGTSLMDAWTIPSHAALFSGQEVMVLSRIPLANCNHQGIFTHWKLINYKREY